jgi:putative transposase
MPTAYVCLMPRKPRADLPDSIHHIAALAGGDQQLFREVADRECFMEQLRDVVARCAWRCDAYCLMDTHFHLIVYTREPTLSAGMRRLCGAYAQSFNSKYGRRGHLFANRFASKHIIDDAHLLEAHRYVALNPVRARMCEDPAQWRWGSYRALCGLERPIDFLDVDAVLGLFSEQREAARSAYRDFVLGSDPRPSGVRPPSLENQSTRGKSPPLGQPLPRSASSTGAGRSRSCGGPPPRDR